MKTMPLKCVSSYTVGSFCECIADAAQVDVAARAFCELAKSDSNKTITGDDLVELKKALMDIESET